MLGTLQQSRLPALLTRLLAPALRARAGNSPPRLPQDGWVQRDRSGAPQCARDTLLSLARHLHDIAHELEGQVRGPYARCDARRLTGY